MIRSIRPALAAIAGLLVLVASASFAATAAPPLPERDRVWAQDYSDLKPDPQVRFGRLPNGMRYALMRNETPKGQASIRLRFGTGSLHESDAQQGLAHYLEHMAFNGSTKVPPGEMVRLLERNGLAFGADTNASTNFTETVYQLDLPNTSEPVVDLGLMLMREVVSELTIAPQTVEQERGVVLSEERARDTPAYRLYKARLNFLLQGQLAPKRLPIGTTDVLRSAGREQLKAYYDANYRPERTTLVMVGDFDPAAVETKIRGQFADWQARTPKPREPDLGQVAPRQPDVELVVEPGGSLSIQLSWIGPFDATPDSRAKRRRDLVRYVAFSVLNRRLERLARAGDPPFIGASAGYNDQIRSATLASLSVNADPAQWRSALVAAGEARRRALQYGLRQDEVDREITELRVSFQQAAAAAATRRTPRLASELIQAVDDGEVFTSPADDLALFEEAMRGLTAEQVTSALRVSFTGQGPLLFMASPRPVAGGEAAVAEALRQAQTSQLAAPAASEAKRWPYTSFGAPGRVAERREVTDLQTHFIRFENGVRLTVKPTQFRDEQILATVRFGHGLLEMPKDRTPPWGVGSAFIEGGLKDITSEDMEEVLASKIFNVDLNLGEEAFSLSGSTRPADLDTQLQVLTAYLTSPGWRPEGFQRMRTYGLTLHRQMEATPQGVLRRDLSLLLRGGDPRWRFPSEQEIAAGRPEDVRRLLERPLSQGPLEVVIVGDVTVERAIEAVAATLGALPPRQGYPSPSPAARDVDFPAASLVERTHKGRADQAVAYMAWPTSDFFADPKKARESRVLQLIMELRLIDEIRIAQGATYSPSTGWESSTSFPGYGYLSASVEIPRERIEGFFSDVGKIAASLRDKDVTADELERAKKPRIEAIQRSKQTNEYWLGQLGGAQQDPRRLESIRAAVPGLEQVSVADVRRAAQEYLAPEKVWRLIVRPE